MSSADAMRWFTGENDSSEPQCDLGRLITLTRKRFDVERKRDRYRTGVDMLLAMDEEQRATNAILDLAGQPVLFDRAPGRIRTCGLLLRRQTLYPLSYGGA
jgi:hypothetical protein